MCARWTGLIIWGVIAWAGHIEAWAGRIDLVLLTHKDVSQADVQAWYQALTAIGVDSLQVRSATANDQLEIIPRAAGNDPSYQVKGQLTARGELVVPGGRFMARDKAAISTWLDRLRKEGPARAQGAPPPPYGMSADQLMQLRRDLARAVVGSTRQKPLRDVIAQEAKRLSIPLAIDKAAEAAIQQAGEVRDELSGVAVGTALAASLRAAGLVIVPRLSVNRQSELALVPSAVDQQFWPVGWPPSDDKPDRKLLPSMFEFVNVELDDIAITDLLAGIAGRLECPVLLDHNGLVRQGIDLTQIKVSMPAAKSTYSLVLSRMLFKGKVRYEIRVDDAGAPFLWVFPR